MRRSFSIVGLLCALFMAIISVAQAQAERVSVGNEASPVAILREFGNADGRWCWRGLCLGQTLLREASTRLRNQAEFGDLINIKDQGTSSLAWEWRDHPNWVGLLARPRDGDTLARLNFALNADTLSLADAIALFGVPQDVYIQGIGGDLLMQICFAHQACVWIVQHNGMLNPAAPIIGIDFMTDDAFQAQLVYGTESIKWRGFTNYTPGWWYRFVN